MVLMKSVKQMTRLRQSKIRQATSSCRYLLSLFSSTVSYFVFMIMLVQFDKLNITVVAPGVTEAEPLVDVPAETVALTLVEVPALLTVTLYGVPHITLLHIAC